METAPTSPAATTLLASRAPAAGRPLASQARAFLETMQPSYFALVMATGVVAVGADLGGMHDVARFLFWTSLVAYVALWALTAARVATFPAAFLRDLSSHARAPGFFAAVAATAVVGMELRVIAGDVAWGPVVWWASAALWAACTYSVFVALIVAREKPSLADGIHGGWLLAVVGTQSLCALGCAIGPSRVLEGDAGLFLMLSLWLCGGMLYVWLISLIFYRYLFFRFSPSDLMPPFWINMGAVAISALAGTSLVEAAAGSALLTPLLPFVKGLTIMFWATATWWIPMIVLLGVWRHTVRGVRIAYDPLYWGLVFPLGMYALCTRSLARVVGLGLLDGTSRTFLVAALVAWFLTFLGLLGRLLHALVLARPSSLGLLSPGAPAPRRPLHASDGATPMNDHTPEPLTREAAERGLDERASGGRNLVFLGFVVAVIGVVVYCTACLGSTPDPAEGVLPASTPVARLALGLIGLGTLAWLVGSIRYLRAVLGGGDVAPAPSAPEANEAQSRPSATTPHVAMGS